MILLADSGSTKTDWYVGNQVNVRYCATKTEQFQTPGINPVHQTADAIRATLPTLQQPVSAVYFYGAGCTAERIPLMTRLLQEQYPGATVSVHSDLLGAARALCGRSEGIACILGTGANSGLYDGEHIVQNTPALGYILGDEGSGAVLGRLFVNAIFKHPDFAAIRDEYLAQAKLTQADIIQRVYREPMANRFLASTSLFIGQHMDNPLLSGLVVQNFRQFFRANIVPYRHPELPVHFVGSMAHHYRPQLEEAARMEGFQLGHVLKSPMEGLVAFHAQ